MPRVHVASQQLRTVNVRNKFFFNTAQSP